MGRLKEFELTNALEKAMNVFWVKGYDQASLKDLLAEMNILNGSFYNSFGSKKNLFLETIKHYNDKVTASRGQILEEAPTFKEGIREFFKEIFNCHRDTSTPNGCLLVNSFSSELSQDEKFQQYLKDQTINFENFFVGMIQKAIDRGELSADIDPKVTSSILVTYIQGIMKQSSLGFSVDKVEKQTLIFLDSIGL